MINVLHYAFMKLKMGILEIGVILLSIFGFIFTGFLWIVRVLSRFRILVAIFAFIIYMDIEKLSDTGGRYSFIKTEIAAFKNFDMEWIEIFLVVVIALVYFIIIGKIHEWVECFNGSIKEGIESLKDKYSHTDNMSVNVKASYTTATSMQGSIKKRIDRYKKYNTNYYFYDHIN